DQVVAFIRAVETDPVSAFGGVMGFNHTVAVKTAQEILKNFVEAVIAPGFEPEALELFAKKKNIRLMKMAAVKNSSKQNEAAPRKNFDFKKISGGLLVQEADEITYDPSLFKVVSKRKPDEQEMEALKFAWVVAKHVKSNAIVYARENETIGIGAGQMSRVDSSRLALEKANKPIEGCVMASDAFFPFRDSIDAAASEGIAAVIQPGGSIRDEEVIQAADENDMAMVFTGIRHFKH
ncbi:MAG: bifunctional phosphoribosylaminoimidazolecarboxamide formyltransferase/IMP cyclohydrolase, partial [Nitrospinales bacterium]